MTSKTTLVDEHSERQSLFERDEEGNRESSSSSSSKNDDADRLLINKSFAKEYMSRKQREELRRVEQDHDDNDDDDDTSTSSSEDEDGELLTPSMDVTILNTINALRSKDQRIYDSSCQFFPKEEEGRSGDGTDKTEKRLKPKRFKDVIREQILEQMDQQEEKEDGSAAEEQARDSASKQEAANRLVYDQEQKSLRSAFLDSTKGDDGDEEDWMVVKKKGAVDSSHDEDAEKLLQQELQVLEKTKTNDLQDPRGEVQDGDQFLLDFIKNKKWIDKTEGEDPESSDGHHDNDDDSIEQLDRTDDFESHYNFRFEEAAAEAASGASGADHSMIGYARSGTMNTLRRKDETRKNRRLERKERKAAERKAKEEQLRRLKNAKREEMESKLKQIRSVLGEVEDGGDKMDEAALMKLMEGEFDPDKFEELMTETYGDDFYAQKDTEWKTDADVRESLLKDEDGDLLVGQDSADGGLYDNQEEEDGELDQNEEWDEEQQYDEDEDAPLAPVDNSAEETRVDKKLREKMQEELYKLDYEDIIAGMPTRFKYRKVEPNTYGLSTEEILFAKDSTLKNFVSLKKMAPYREEGEHFVGGKRRRKFREMLKQDVEEIKAQQEINQNEVEEDATPLKKKRRRQKKGKKKEASQQDDEVGMDIEETEIETNDKSTGEVKQVQKRKRRKNGTKQPKDSTEDDRVDPTPTLQKAAALDATDGITTKDNSKKNSKKKKKSSKLNKERKRRKKGASVEGVSASRLASYGL